MANIRKEPLVIELSSSSSEEDVEKIEDADHKCKHQLPHSNGNIISPSGGVPNNGASGASVNVDLNVENDRNLNVVLFMDICGVKDKTQAMRQLQRFDYDMDRAVAAHFDQTKTRRNHDHAHKEVEILEETTTSSTSHSNSRVHVHSVKSDDAKMKHTKIYNKQTSSRNGHRYQCQYQHQHQHQHQRHHQHRPSQKWESIMEKCKELKVQFIDEEFPPTTTSLDGRKLQGQTQTLAQTHNHSSAPETVTHTASAPKKVAIKCHCGIPASIRAVQKDGPNYGRFFLSCGKPRRRPPKPKPATTNINTTKKRKRKQQEDETNKSEKTSTGGKSDSVSSNEVEAEGDRVVDDGRESSSSGIVDIVSLPTSVTALDKMKSKEQCHFFKWDDDHVQDNSKGRNAWTHKLSWFRFSSEHGYTLTGRIPGGDQFDSPARTHTGTTMTSNFGKFLPDHVRQGAMGNCWFLSALAVVAEKPYLIQRILPHDHINHVGCFEVNFCLDGKWTNVIVDSLLPSIARLESESSKGSSSSSSSRKSARDKRKGAFHTDSGIIIQPAFAAGTVMWPAIIEKVCSKYVYTYRMCRMPTGFYYCIITVTKPTFSTKLHSQGICKGPRIISSPQRGLHLRSIV